MPVDMNVRQRPTAGSQRMTFPTTTTSISWVQATMRLLATGEAVQKSNLRAIALNWQVLYGLQANQLKNGFIAVAMRFVEKAKQQQAGN